MRCELLVISCGTVQRKAKEGKEVSMVVTNPFHRNLPEEEMIIYLLRTPYTGIPALEYPRDRMF